VMGDTLGTLPAKPTLREQRLFLAHA